MHYKVEIHKIQNAKTDTCINVSKTNDEDKKICTFYTKTLESLKMMRMNL